MANCSFDMATQVFLSHLLNDALVEQFLKSTKLEPTEDFGSAVIRPARASASRIRNATAAAALAYFIACSSAVLSDTPKHECEACFAP
jgi:hypothetical protein